MAVPRRRVWLRRAGWALGALSVVAIAVYLTRNRWAPPLLARLAPRFGYEASVESVAGDWFGELALRGVECRALKADLPLQALTGRSLAVELSLLELFRGGNWLRRAEAEGVRVMLLDTGEETDTDVDVAEIVDALPELALRDVSVGFESASGMRVEVDELAADLHRSGEGVAFEMGGGILGAKLQLGGTLKGRTLESELHISGLDWQRMEDAFGLANEAEPRGVVDLEGHFTVDIDHALGFRVEASLEVEDLRLAGRVLGPAAARLELDGLDLRAPWIELAGSANRLRLEDVEWNFAADDLDEALTTASARFDVSLADVGALVDPEHHELPDVVTEHRLLLAGRLQGGRLELDTGRLELTTGALDVNEGSLVIAGAERGRLALDLDAQVADLAVLDAILGHGPFGGALAGAVQLSGTLQHPLGEAMLSGEDVVLFGVELGALELDVHSDTERLRIRAARADCPTTQVQVAGAFEYATGQFEELALSACLADGSGLDLPEWVEELGPAQVEARLSGPLEALSGTVHVEASDAVIGGLPIATFELRGSANHGQWYIPRLVARGAAGDLELGLSVLPDAVERAGATGLTIELDRASLVRGAETLALTRPAALHFERGAAGTEPIHLAGTAGELEVSGSFTDEEGRARIDIQGLRPAAFFEEIAGYQLGGLDAALEVDWSPVALELRTQGELAGFSWPGAPRTYELSWAADYDAGVLSIEELVARADGTEVLRGAGSAALELTRPWLGDGPVDIVLSIRHDLPPELGIPATSLTGAVAVELELGGTWRALEGSLHATAERLELTSPRGIPHELAAKCSVSIGEELSIDELDLRVDSVAHLSASGRVGTRADLAGMVEAGELPLDAPIDLTGAFEGADLGWIASEIDGMRRLDGRIAGDVHVGGTLGRPEPRGSLQLTDGDLRLTQDLPPIRQLDASVAIEPSELRIERLVGELGGAPLAIEGRIQLAGDAPTADLRIRGQNVLVRRSADLLIRADADLVLSGPVSACTLAGELTLRDSRLLSDVDLLGSLRRTESRPQSEGIQLFSLRDAPLSTMKFDVRVTTDEPLELVSNVADGSLRLDLHLGGSGEVPTLGGRIFVDSLRLLLPGGKVTFPGGLVLFDDPFHPTLELQGEARLAGYDITMRISGPYDSPEILLSSVPALSNDELLLLVLTGQVPASASAAGQGAGQSLSVYLARDFLRGLSDRRLDDSESVLERIDITSGREVSKSGVETVEVTYRIAEPWIKVGDEQYFVAERDVYEHVNGGLRFVFRFQ